MPRLGLLVREIRTRIVEMPKGSASRATSLLKKVEKELRSIPQYTGEKAFSSGSRSAYNNVEAVKNAITGLRRGIRILSGGESKPSLIAKRNKLKSLIQEAQDLKEIGFEMDKGMEKGKREYTTRTKARYLEQRQGD